MMVMIPPGESMAGGSAITAAVVCDLCGSARSLKRNGDGFVCSDADRCEANLIWIEGRRRGRS